MLVENFPDGEIRIINEQNFEMMPTKTFIETYIPKESQKDYLNKLHSKLESIHRRPICSNIDNMQSNPNIETQQNMIEHPATENTNYIINKYNINSKLKEPDGEAKSSRNDISENSIISCLRSYCPCYK